MAPVLKADVDLVYRGFESLLIRRLMSPNNYRLFIDISSDGSSQILKLPRFRQQSALNVKDLDVNNHSIWTGKRPDKQTEISTFINRIIR